MTFLLLSVRRRYRSPNKINVAFALAFDGLNPAFREVGDVEREPHQLKQRAQKALDLAQWQLEQ